MNWKQTIGLVITVGAIIALCFLVIFPALYDKEEPEKPVVAKKVESAEAEGDRSVLPKLKGVNWETAPKLKKPSEKKQPKEAEKKAEVEEPPAPEEAAPAGPEGVRPEESGAAPLLELQEMSWYDQEGYIVVDGTVKNVSSSSLPTVQAHVTFEGAEGWLISEEHAMIELNPIFPGQVSRFSVISRYYPEIISVVLDFRTFSGESIPWSKVEVVDEESGADERELPLEEDSGGAGEETVPPSP
jgi:hypothetical protein